MTLRISESAAADLEHIYDYIARDSPDAALETLTDLYETMERLIRFPQLGHPGSSGSTRELLNPPFAIVYRIVVDVISIEAVFHGSRSYT